MSKREYFREKRRQAEARNRLIWVGAIILVAIVAVSFVVFPILNPPDIITITPIPRAQADFNHLGDPNAPVQIVEFGDFQCPHCADFATDTEQLLVAQYVDTGKVYFTYRSVGSFIGQESVDAASAAYCAGDQGKFWEYHDMIFANQRGENEGRFSNSRLTAFARSLGLNMTEFNSCFNNDKYKDQVTQDANDALTAGVQATPTFILTYTVNGQVQTETLSGAQPINIFQQEIDKAFAAMGK
jgi:protein-disulfide isomerase